MTQEKVCSGICSIPYLSKLENGKLEVKRDTLELLCERLSINMQELTNDDEQVWLNKLDNLYYLIESRQIHGSIREKINEIKDKKPNFINNPRLYLTYQVVLFNYYLSIRDKNSCRELKNKLEIYNQRHKHLDKKIEFRLLKSIGFYEYLLGSVSKSKKYYYQALHINDKASYKDATLLYRLGLVHTQMMETSLSISFAERASHIFMQQMNIKSIIDCQLLIGINYNRSSNYEKAKTCFLQILQSTKFSSSKNDPILGKIYHNLGYSYLLERDIEDAIKYLKLALKTKKTLQEQMSTMYLLAYTYKLIKNKRMLNALIKKGMECEKINKSFYYKFYLLNSIKGTELNYELNDTLIDKITKEIYPYFLKHEPKVAIECLLLLAGFYEKKKQYKKASIYYKKAFSASNNNQKRREILF